MTHYTTTPSGAAMPIHVDEDDIYTPAPWISAPLSEKYINVKRIIKDAKGHIICYVVLEDEACSGISNRGQHVLSVNERNANLMAAAPELLKALEEIERMIIDGGEESAYEMKKIARAALTKTRGEEEQ